MTPGTKAAPVSSPIPPLLAGAAAAPFRFPRISGIADMGKGRRILVVDDESSVTLLIGQLLELHGFESRAASSARGALEILPEWNPDLILLDIAMPEMDGSELFARLRLLPRTARTPVIFVTGLIGPEEEEEFNRSAGARKHYLAKPFAPEKLLAAINSLLG